METLVAETPIMQKTKELCQTILDQPDMRQMRERIEAFLGDESSRNQYESLVNKSQTLQQAQQSRPLGPEEIAEFEKEREALLNNPVARGFLDAQEEMHHVQQTVHQYVSKTLELGRLPTEEDLSGGGGGGGGCGHGCGCSH